MSKISPLLLLFFLLLLHVICWLILEPIYPFDDAYIYAKKAHEFSEGTFRIKKHYFDNRFGVFIPTGLIFSVFGVHPYSIALWPLICSLGIITSLFYFLKKQTSTKLAFLAGLLLATNFLQTTYATTLFPDLIIALWASLTAYCIYLGRAQQNTVFAVAAVFFFFVGVLTKVLIVLTLPFYLFLMLYDLYKKQHLRFWMVTLTVFTSLAVLYFFTYYLLSGEAFYRYNLVEHHHNDDFRISGTALWKRLTYAPILWLIQKPSYYLLMVLAIPFSFLALRKKSSPLVTYWSGYLLCLLAMHWWGSSSFSGFTPIMLFDRMWLMLLVPLVIMTVFAVFHFKKYWKKADFSIFLISALGVYFLVRNSNHTLPSALDNKTEAELILSLNKGAEKNLMLDVVRFQNYIIYNGFQPLEKVQVYYWGNGLPDNEKPVYLLINQSRMEFMKTYVDDIVPEFVQDLEGWQLVEQREGVSLFLKDE